MHKARQLTAALVSLLALLTPSPGVAQGNDIILVEPEAETKAERWWQVELIVFLPKNQSVIDQEKWPQQRELALVQELPWLNELLTPQPEGAENDAEQGSQPIAPMTTTPPLNNQQAGFVTDQNSSIEQTELALDLLLETDSPLKPRHWFEVTPEEQWLLKEQAAQMRWTKDYDILLHQSWRHHLEADSEPLSYRLVAGSELSGLGPDVGSNGWLPIEEPDDSEVQSNNIVHSPVTAAIDMTSDPVQKPPQPHYQVEGKLSFELHRYLHIKTDMWVSLGNPAAVINNSLMSPESHSQPLPTPEFIFGHHQQSRRVRSSEVHYLDHPLLGMIITIVPWEPPPEQDLVPDENITTENAPPVPY
jgi:hypothetical protein